jgi:hypothetical protein
VPVEGFRHPESGVLAVRINRSPQDSLEHPPIQRFAVELASWASTKVAGEPTLAHCATIEFLDSTPLAC